MMSNNFMNQCLPGPSHKTVIDQCNEITQQLKSATSLKELRTIFPNVVERVFGSSSCLQINTLNNTYRSAELSAARSLLSPAGAVMDAAYRLLADGSALFPKQLPGYVRLSRSPGTDGSYLTSRLSPQHQQQYSNYGSPTHSGLQYSRCSSSPSSSSPAATSQAASAASHTVLLNSFEFLVVNFLLFPVVNASGLSTSAALAGRSDDGLYSQLLKDYLNYLIPISGELDTLDTIPGLMPRSPQAHMSEQYQQASALRSLRRRTPHSGSSFNSSHLNSSHFSTTSAAHTVWDQRDSDTWRSTCFIQLICELWMGWGSAVSSQTALSTYINQLFNEQQLPSTDLILLTRSVIKHCHHCSSLAPLPEMRQSAMDLLRGRLVKKYIRRPALTFMHYLFDKWPLDSSFKIVLELWLSFVQPWRYTDQAVSERQKNANWVIKDPLDEAIWFPFVLETLPCYSLMLRSLLMRLQHMDLRVARTAALLYRAAKLLVTPNLSRLIRAAEKSLSYSDLQQPAGSSLAAAVTQELSELLPAGLSYTPMFSTDTCRLAEQTILSIQTALESTPQPTGSKNSDVTGRMFKWLGVDQLQTMNTMTGGMMSPDDPNRLHIYLTDSCRWLADFFELDVDRIHPGSADRQTSTDQSRVTPTNFTKAEITYSGDPEMQPIRSYEVAFLVRLMHSVAVLINRKFGASFANWYSSEGFKGHLSHLLLTKPYTSSRTLSQSSFSASYHMADLDESLYCDRAAWLSLRMFADQRCLVWLAVCLIVASLFGFNSVQTLFVLVLGVLLVAVLHAAFHTVLGTPVQ